MQCSNDAFHVNTPVKPSPDQIKDPACSGTVLPRRRSPRAKDSSGSHHHGLAFPLTECHMNRNILNIFFCVTSLILNDSISFLQNFFSKFVYFCHNVLVLHYLSLFLLYFNLFNNFRVPYFIETLIIFYQSSSQGANILLFVLYYIGSFPYVTLIFYCKFVFLRIIFPQGNLYIWSLEVPLSCSINSEPDTFAHCIGSGFQPPGGDFFLFSSSGILGR